MQADLSIIVPAYKPEFYLGCFFESISQLDLALTKSSLCAELIFIHSGSGAINVSNAPKWESINLKYFHYPRQIEPSEARNIGFSHSVGEYVHFHDVDDKLNTEFVREFTLHIKRIESRKPDIILFKYIKKKGEYSELIDHAIHSSTRELNAHDLREYVRRYIYEPHKYTAFVHCWSKLYRREYLEKYKIRYDQRLNQLEDVNFNFKLLINNPTVIVADAVLYEYTVAPEGASNLSSKSGDDPDERIKLTARAYLPVKRFLIMQGCAYGEAKILLGQLYATTFTLWILRAKKRRSTYFSRYHLVDKYCKSKFVRCSMKFYRRMPETSYWLPKWVRFGISALASI